MRKTRPALIVSNDSCNTHGARVVVVPITSNVSSLYPGEARITVGGKPARALGDQVRSVDKVRVRSRLARLSPEAMHDVEVAVRITLDLRS